jgi:hypothetical protein
LTAKRKGMHFGMRMLFLVDIGTIDQRCIPHGRFEFYSNRLVRPYG